MKEKPWHVYSAQHIITIVIFQNDEEHKNSIFF